MNTDRCLAEDEVIALLLNDPVTRTREEVHIHLSGCADCKDALNEALEFNARLDNSEAVATGGRGALNLLRASIDEIVAYVGEFQAPWGRLGVAVTDRGVTRIEFGATADRVAELVAGDGLIPEPAANALAPLEEEMDEYFEGKRRRFDIP
ncbi:MAG TPA: hypothetical protein VFZ12_08545, partial [Dehalococcoidia bacterium]|nr:hypothetical protein [Dehalococcoidia bacterium]